MSGPTWTILIPTIPQREALFRGLLDALLPQLDAHGGQVRVVAWRNAGELSVGDLRDRMMHYASGSEYINFVDDDDRVPEYYVSEVVTALAERPHHVGFQLAYYLDGNLEEIVDHSLRHGDWRRNEEGMLVRDFTHVDPIRWDVATRGRFGQAKRGRAEDRVWCKAVRPFIATEVYIDKIMYHYLWVPAASSWRRQDRVQGATTPLPAINHPYFSWHPESR